MALPPNVSTVTVTGTYLDATGVPLSGAVTFEPSVPLADASSEPPVMIGELPVTKQLVDGAFSVVLPATDDPDVTPTGFTYTVTENLALFQFFRTYSIQLPAATPNVDLADVAPVIPVDEVTTELTEQDLGTRVFGWDVHNDVTLPPGLQLATITLDDQDVDPDELPHRFRFVWDGLQTGGFNQFGEIRSFASSDGRVAMRATGRSETHNESIFEALLYRGGPLRFAVKPESLVATVPIDAPNVKGAVVSLVDGEPVPPGLQAGTVVVRYVPTGDPDVITYVGGDADGTSGQTLSLGWPAGIEVDDYAVVWWTSSSGSGQPNPPTGFTRISEFEGNSGSQLSALYARRCLGSETGSFDAVGGGFNRQCAVLSVYRGVNAADPIHFEVIDTAASGTSHTAPDIDITHDGSVVVLAYSERLSSGTVDITPPAGYIRRQHSADLAHGGGGTYIATADDGLAGHSPGTVSPGAWTDSVANENAILWSVALRPALDTAEFTASSVSVLGQAT